MEVTITHLEQMRLSAEGLSDPGSLMWSQEITHEKAHNLLQKELYRYKQVCLLKCDFAIIHYSNFSAVFYVSAGMNIKLY